mmetsp:Transcript_58727/g.170368  ORF Transcript_58727/g.170368 Transcript_58727/m.170368 type:complete len:233 (-) Transcript_58727:93-791(-)
MTSSTISSSLRACHDTANCPRASANSTGLPVQPTALKKKTAGGESPEVCEAFKTYLKASPLLFQKARSNSKATRRASPRDRELHWLVRSSVGPGDKAMSPSSSSPARQPRPASAAPVAGFAHVAPTESCTEACNTPSGTARITVLDRTLPSPRPPLEYVTLTKPRGPLLRGPVSSPITERTAWRVRTSMLAWGASASNSCNMHGAPATSADAAKFSSPDGPSLAEEPARVGP